MPHNLIITPHSIPHPTSIVHTEYDPTTLEPVPSPAWSRFICISDIYSYSFNVLPAAQWEPDDPWYRSRVLEDRGLVDRAAILELLKGPRAIASGLVYLENEEHTFQVEDGGRTWSVYGSPWSPYFCNWAFNYKPEDGPGPHSHSPLTPISDPTTIHSLHRLPKLTSCTSSPLSSPPFPLTYSLFLSSVFPSRPPHTQTNTLLPQINPRPRTNHGDLPVCPALRTHLPELHPHIHVAGHVHEGRGAYVHAWAEEAQGEEAPRVQNDNWYRDSDSDSGEEDKDEDENEDED
ncbi:hypothetical protein Hypma_002927 [Hypsizygus marmoreus]|uniref:Metallophosphoesterase domain-containing protein 1 n=1 Tax=Hypsizygus marmoreus TaxID=39966 RepID=A0A369J337_HYPMA|nr:hypothetical protein Hypma_002927 [Hypsizygus marmoreus]